MPSTSRYLWRATVELRHPETYASQDERLHRDSVVATTTTTDSQMVLDTLRGMKRGESQMDGGRFFSETSAKNDPRATADHFDELMPLRNVALERSAARIPPDEFAGILMKFQMAKDAAEPQAHLEDPPADPQKILCRPK